MTDIRLGCSACREYLTVEVENDSGPWSPDDEAALMDAAERDGWFAFIRYGDMAFVYCPDHVDEGRLVRSAL